MIVRTTERSIAMPYSARATTVGNSRALSFEASLFRAHPEFGEGRFEAHVIAPGTMLVTTAAEAGPDDPDADPVLGAYLAFLEQEMIAHPEGIRPLSAEWLERALEVVEGVEVDLDEDLGDDVVVP
jgi:prlF antitoxin for toxin YhaV_toxin